MIYHTEPYDKMDEKEQWIRISEGCPNQCEYCYAPAQLIRHPIPEIKRNFVKIMDMNILYNPDAKEIIEYLGQQKVNGKVVKYELICGVDFRRMTQEIANLLKKSRFVNIRLAWDYGLEFKDKIREVITQFITAGYNPKLLSVFILCNWKINYFDVKRKIEYCKQWDVKAVDCWFDNQTSPNIVTMNGWTKEQIIALRGTKDSLFRKHNQFVRFGCDPERIGARA